MLVCGAPNEQRRIARLTFLLDSVPAEYASFRLHDALLSRLSNDGQSRRSRLEMWLLGRADSPRPLKDSIEKSLSTFAAEMATTSMILGSND